MAINKGDKVRAAGDGPEMEVLAIGNSLAICEWQADGHSLRDVFEIGDLKKVTAGQQAQQPQPTPKPT